MASYNNFDTNSNTANFGAAGQSAVENKGRLCNKGSRTRIPGSDKSLSLSASNCQEANCRNPSEDSEINWRNLSGIWGNHANKCQSFRKGLNK